MPNDTSNTDGHTSNEELPLFMAGDTHFSTEINVGPTFQVEKKEVNPHTQNSKPSSKREEQKREKALTEYKQEL